MWRANTKSSFDGIIIELPDVSVDNFEDTESRVYFLSHCHTDHMRGLFSEELFNHLKKDDVFIYTSKPSADIIRHETQNKELAEYVKPLEIGSTTIFLPEYDGEEEEYLTVTLIPAGHCFGSVMFLFKTLYSTVLYTGDFRISTNSVSKYGQLHDDNGDPIKLDALYVDTTFQDVQYEEFPKRSDSVETVIERIEKWLSVNESNQVALHTSAKYGYEFVFNKIYKCLGLKVHVDDDTWKLYSQCPKQVYGVTNEFSRIHRCQNRSESAAHHSCVTPTPDSKTRFLYIHFSAMKWKEYQFEDNNIQTYEDRCRIDACFATHCSRSELLYFVNYLAPERVVGFPEEYVMNKIVAEPVKELTESSPKESPPISILEMGKLLDEDTVRALFDDLD